MDSSWQARGKHHPSILQSNEVASETRKHETIRRRACVGTAARLEYAAVHLNRFVVLGSLRLKLLQPLLVILDVHEMTAMSLILPAKTP